MAVACLALFVALGGVGYAAVTINGKNIQNGTIAGKKLKRNTLTGRQINESRLGAVPAAARAATAASADNATNAVNAQNAANAANATNAVNATNATNAANAASLNGGQLQRISFLRAPDNQDVTILSNFHGLSIEAVCETGANLVVNAINSATGKAAIRVTRTNSDGTVSHNQDSDMSNGDTVLLKPNDPPAGIVTLAYGTQGGTNVSAVLNITENPFGGVNDDCFVTGTATGFPQ